MFFEDLPPPQVRRFQPRIRNINPADGEVPPRPQRLAPRPLSNPFQEGYEPDEHSFSDLNEGFLDSDISDGEQLETDEHL